MKKLLIEICASNVESAITAGRGGADRIELCSALPLGGLTPSIGTLEFVLKNVTIPVNVLIRPREGNFNYSRPAFQSMKSDVFSVKAAGANGIVVGMLNTDGSIDTCRMKELVEMAKPMEVTFHRAFDASRDVFESLEKIIELGCDRILTSGADSGAMAGASVLAELVKVAGDSIRIMPGGGINENNLLELVAITKAREYHLSASTMVSSRMKFHNKKLILNSDGIDESGNIETDMKKIRRICELLSSIS